MYDIFRKHIFDILPFGQVTLVWVRKKKEYIV